MIAREKMLNAMQDCRSIKYTYSEMEALAKTDTYEMIDDFVEVLRELREELDELKGDINKLNSRL
jgi:hypothetical protein